GEITTPAIMQEDTLIVASGSGTTSSVILAVQKAKKNNACVIGITTDIQSTVAQQADLMIHVPAAGKTDFSDNISKQYAASLFEQFTLFLLDGIFMTLWRLSGKTKEELWPKHANLE
ncbi:MAG TPA: SIS domain-containing protein, partial [Arachidicoccus sp.]